MKKYIAPAVALAAALAIPTAAQATVTQDFSISASPAKSSTSKKKYPITLSVSTGTKDDTGAQPPTTKNATIFFPKGSVWNGDLFPKCKASVIDGAKSTEDCPSGSIVGSGKAAGLAPGPITQNDLKITVANGGKSVVNMFVEGTSPLRIQSNIEAKVSYSKGGVKLSVPIPANLQEPAPGVPVAITLFSVKVGKSAKIKGKKRGIIEVNKCDGGKWSGNGTFDYVNAPSIDVARSIKCSKG